MNTEIASLASVHDIVGGNIDISTACDQAVGLVLAYS